VLTFAYRLFWFIILWLLFSMANSAVANTSEKEFQSQWRQANAVLHKKQYRKALPLLQKLMRQIPNDIRKKERIARLSYLIGMSYYHLQRWQQARYHLQQALRLRIKPMLLADKKIATQIEINQTLSEIQQKLAQSRLIQPPTKRPRPRPTKRREVTTSLPLPRPTKRREVATSLPLPRPTKRREVATSLPLLRPTKRREVATSLPLPRPTKRRAIPVSSHDAVSKSLAKKDPSSSIPSPETLPSRTKFDKSPIPNSIKAPNVRVAKVEPRISRKTPEPLRKPSSAGAIILLSGGTALMVNSAIFGILAVVNYNITRTTRPNATVLKSAEQAWPVQTGVFAVSATVGIGIVVVGSILLRKPRAVVDPPDMQPPPPKTVQSSVPLCTVDSCKQLLFIHQE
jgi:hypothetical protein